MDKLILVRYGQHSNAHLNEQGIQAMISVSERLKPFVQNKNTCIVSAKVPRAIESANIISKNLNISSLQIFQELYVAQEEGILTDLDAAIKVLDLVGKEYDIVIAVVSREYIDILPSYIVKSWGLLQTIETNLKRGEALVIDYKTKRMEYLKS